MGEPKMTAESILEEISGILEDDSIPPTSKVYEIKDIVDNEVVDGIIIRLNIARRCE